MKRNRDDEKLNTKKLNDVVIDDKDLSLDDELKSSGNGWSSFVSWNKNTWAAVYKWFKHHPMLTYSVKRILLGLVTLLVTIIIVFLLVRAVTSDTQYYPPGLEYMNLTDDQKAELLEQRMKAYGVYGSLGTQLGNYLRDLFPLIPKQVPDSWTYEIVNGAMKATPHTKTVWLYLGVVVSPQIAQPGTDVLSVFNESIPYTFLYALIAVVISFLIAIPLGIEAARYKGKTADVIINGLAIVLTAIPAMVIVVGFYLIATNVNGTSGLFASGSFWSKFWGAVSLILVIAPPQVIMTRRYVMDEMTNEYIKFALSQGLSERFTFFVYVFRNSAARILKAIPLELVLAMFGSTILIEQQWSIPGMGSKIVAAIGGVKDSFVIMGFVSFAAFIQIFGTLISDLIVVGLDPRASLNQRK